MTELFFTTSGQVSAPECPSCGALLPASTQVSDSPTAPATPKAGDWTVCLYCASPLVYGAGGQTLISPDETVLAAMEKHSTFRSVRRAAVDCLKIRLSKNEQSQ